MNIVNILEFKLSVLVAAVLTVIMSLGFIMFEPQLGLAVEDQVVVNQSVTSGIAITSPSDVTMSRAITSAANTSVGTSTWTVTTNNQAGYTLSLSASSTAGCADKGGEGTLDALCDVATGEAFTDVASSTKATWSVTSDYAFGFSSTGTDVTGWGTGSVCESTVHIPSATLFYQGFDGTNLIEIASSTSVTGTSGTATDVCFAAEQNGVFAPSGSYQATTTATAVVQ